MSDPQPATPTFRHYFVDEAGDPNLFKHRGKTIVGKDGCSNFFVLGLADVADPETVGAELESLRKTLLADPYFKDVPSFDPARRKTAIAFHPGLFMTCRVLSSKPSIWWVGARRLRSIFNFA